MNEEPSAKSSFRLHSPFWFYLPVLGNIYLIVKLTDSHLPGLRSYAQLDQMFSVPYWMMVMVIGYRRFGRMTILDCSFLVVGQVLSIGLLYRLVRYWASSTSQ